MKKSKNAQNKSQTNASNHLTDETSDQKIAAVAYSIWEQEGRPEGREFEHWLRAKTQIQLKPGLTATASTLSPQKVVTNTTSSRKTL